MGKNRRKAINCVMLEESKTSPGYFKYQITIREKNGDEHIVPAYGKDMQDAIERLIWNERIDKVTETKVVLPLYAISLILIVSFSGFLGVINDNPYWILGGLITVGLIVSLTTLIDKYLTKN